MAGIWHYTPNCLIPPDQEFPAGLNRVAAVVEYDGSAFCGWQRQSHCHSVQAEVERALSAVAAEPIAVTCAGRTDSGVHATYQVIHFDTSARRAARNWFLGTNANLPDAVRIKWVADVVAGFHARFSARSRTYRYLISNELQRPAIFHRCLTWERRPLDTQPMQQAAALLVGERDFSSFRASACQSRTPFRRVDYASVWRRNDLVVIEIRANAFLHHMVRNIAGALLTVGCHEQDISWFRSLLAARDRTRGAATAAANGLFLVGVQYPAHFGIPEMNPGPHLVPESFRTPDVQEYAVGAKGCQGQLTPAG